VVRLIREAHFSHAGKSTAVPGGQQAAIALEQDFRNSAIRPAAASDGDTRSSQPPCHGLVKKLRLAAEDLLGFKRGAAPCRLVAAGGNCARSAGSCTSSCRGTAFNALPKIAAQVRIGFELA